MELVDYIHIVRRRWVLIVLVLVACVVGAGVATKLTTPTYKTSTRLIVNGASNISGTDEIATHELADERALAFSQIAATPPAVAAALQLAEQTHGPFSSHGYPSVSTSASGTDPFISITVTDTDPHRAQAVANALVTVLPSVLKKLEQTVPATPELIAVVTPAGLPTSPSSPHPKKNLLIGFALGLVLGGGSALVRESLDRRLKDSSDVEDATGLTVLGVVPYDMPVEQVPAASHPMSVRAESYRKIRTNLAFLTESGTPKSVVITSATSSEGKTSLATNLAVACARTGQRVVLVDADLRRPMVHMYLGISGDKGLVDVLAETSELQDVVQYHEEGKIFVVASGPVPTNPSELLGSKVMLDTIRRLEVGYDIVIIDTPPVLPVADALVVGVNVSGVVIVTRLGDTTRDKLRRTKEGLMKVHVNILGVVPNGAVQREDSAYAYAYRYRSRRGKAPTLPYAPRDPQVEPHPEHLTPALRHANGTAVHVPDSGGWAEERPTAEPTDATVLVADPAKAPPKGSHFKTGTTRRRSPSTPTPKDPPPSTNGNGKGHAK